MTNYNESKTPDKKPSEMSSSKSMGEKSSDFISDVKDGANDLVKDSKKYLKENASKDIRAIEEYVTAHPARSLGFAALGGFVLSKLIGGSKK